MQDCGQTSSISVFNDNVRIEEPSRGSQGSHTKASRTSRGFCCCILMPEGTASTGGRRKWLLQTPSCWHDSSLHNKHSIKESIDSTAHDRGSRHQRWNPKHWANSPIAEEKRYCKAAVTQPNIHRSHLCVCMS